MLSNKYLLSIISKKERGKNKKKPKYLNPKRLGEKNAQTSLHPARCSEMEVTFDRHIKECRGAKSRVRGWERKENIRQKQRDTACCKD